MQAMELPTPLAYPAHPPLLTENSPTMPIHQPRLKPRACAMCVKAKAKCSPHLEIEAVCQRYVMIMVPGKE